MHIEHITLHNVGAYYGEQTIKLAHGDNGHGTLTLVMGLNGTGKTTLLNSILLALYGNRSPAIAREQGGYYAYLERVRSRGIAVDEDSFVELELVLRQERLVVRRSWRMASKRIADTLVVKRNGIEDTLLAKAWASHVEDIIPVDLASLFIFDGERIGEIAESESTPPELQRAIKTILGISTIDRLIEDLDRVARRFARKLDRSNTHQEDYRKVAVERETLLLEMNQWKQELAKVTTDLDRAKFQSNQVQSEYFRLGGGFLQEQTLSRARQRINDRLADLRVELMEIAAGPLPLYLVTSLLGMIETQAQKEIDKSRSLAALPVLEEVYSSIISRVGQSIPHGPWDVVDEVITEKLSELKVIQNVKTVYNLSPHAFEQITQLRQSVLVGEKNTVQTLLKSYREYQQELGYIAGQEGRDENGNALEEILNKVKEFARTIGSLEERRAVLEQQLLKLERHVARLANDMSRHAESLAADTEYLRIVKYAERSKTLQERFRKIVLESRVKELEANILNAVTNLLRKDQLISRVQVDPESLSIQIWDYKGNRIPKRSLSSGERQMLALALLWGLSNSKSDGLPVIIDTPMARLDSQHRRRFVDDYLPRAADQVVVLSTDSELTNNDLCRLGSLVGQHYVLDYTESNGHASFRDVVKIGRRNGFDN